MTWLQILYVIALYFTLAEVLFQCIRSGKSVCALLSVLVGFIVDEGKLSIAVFVTASYLLWPITFIVVVVANRRAAIQAVTKKLEAMNARH